MSQVALSSNASGTGTFTIASPNSNTDRTLNLPDADGTVQVSGNPISGTTGTFSGAVQASGVATNLYPLVSGTAVASTSGTAIDFTGIPAWVKRITVMLNGVSTNGTSTVQCQIGTSGGVQTTAYVSNTATIPNSTPASTAVTTGFGLNANMNASVTMFGAFRLNLLNDATGIWACDGVLARGDSAANYAFAGGKTLSGTLDRVRITTVNGTDTFDAGTINILYE
jgi:hypothetical protein